MCSDRLRNGRALDQASCDLNVGWYLLEMVEQGVKHRHCRARWPIKYGEYTTSPFGLPVRSRRRDDLASRAEQPAWGMIRRNDVATGLSSANRFSCPRNPLL